MVISNGPLLQITKRIRGFRTSKRGPLQPNKDVVDVALSHEHLNKVLNIYHYWDLAEPPEEVAANLRTIKHAAPEANITLLDREAAEQLIGHHQGSRALAAFRACGPPAMQADYLRLCIMDSLGGLYIDADDVALKALKTLIDPAPVGLLVVWENFIHNGFLFFRNSKHPFISACLTLATENIEARRFDSVLLVTGPGVLTAMYCAGDEKRETTVTNLVAQSPWNMAHWLALLGHAREVKQRARIGVHLSGDLTLIDIKDWSEWISNRPMSYKSSARHWANWTGSIFERIGPTNQGADEACEPGEN